MMKFFRKHNKKLLAVFMALLLVVWLGGSALTRMLSPDPGGNVLAHTKYGDILVNDHARANVVTESLERLGIRWAILGIEGWPGEPLSLTDWILLSREANALGMAVGRQEVDDNVRAIEHRMRRGNPNASILRLAARFDVRPEQFAEAVAEFLRIQQVLDLVVRAGLPSEAELRLAARDAFETVEVEAVVFDAATFADPEKSFSQDQLEEQFEQYKNSQRRPGSTTFGYYLPPRVNVEYVRIDQSKVSENLRISEANLLDKAKTFWRENRRDSVFTKPKEAPATQPADEATTQPVEPSASQPAEAPESGEPEYYATFPEAREIAMRAVRDRMAAAMTQAVAQWLSQQFAEPWFGVDPGEDRYKVAPQRVKEAGYCDAIVSQLPAIYPYGAAIEVVATDWFRPDEASTLPDIGEAAAPLAEGVSVGFDELALRVQGLLEIPTEGRFNPMLYLSQHQFSSLVLRDDDDNLFLFRVVGVEPAHAPERLDLVRDQVIEDLRVTDGLAEARKALEALKAEAVEASSIATAWEQTGDLKVRVGDTNQGYVGSVELSHPTAPTGSSAPPDTGLGDVDDEFIDACFALGNETGDGPKLAVFELPGTARIALVRWAKTTPLSSDQYVAMHRFLGSGLFARRRSQLMLEWLNPKKIQARNGYERVQRTRRAKKQEQDKEEQSGQEQGKNEGEESDA